MPWAAWARLATGPIVPHELPAQTNVGQREREREGGAGPTSAQIWPDNALGSLGAADNRRHDLAQLRLQHAAAPGIQNARPAVRRKAGQRSTARRNPSNVHLMLQDAA